MPTATVFTKGRITIPANVRQALHVEKGDRVACVEVEPGRFEIVAATRPVAELKGMFGKAKRTVSLEEMHFAIANKGASAR